jgi:hypothetical protein
MPAPDVVRVTVGDDQGVDMKQIVHLPHQIIAQPGVDQKGFPAFEHKAVAVGKAALFGRFDKEDMIA